MSLRGKLLHVDEDAVALHHEEHVRDGDLDLGIDALQLLVAVDAREERAVQLQRDVGVLRRIVGCALDVHLVEGDLGGAAAGDLFVKQRLRAQVALRERIHVVALVAFEHVRLQERVVHHAAHDDAAVGEHVAVVLAVLPDLGLLRILEPALEALQHRLLGELRRPARIPVSDRDVRRLAGRHAEREPHQVGVERIDAARLRIPAHERRALDLLHPRLELLRVRDRLVFFGIDEGDLLGLGHLRHEPGGDAGKLPLFSPLAWERGGGEGSSALARIFLVQHGISQGPEPEFPVKLSELRIVGTLVEERVEIERQGNVRS
jgi:hypothetical protein